MMTQPFSRREFLLMLPVGASLFMKAKSKELFLATVTTGLLFTKEPGKFGAKIGTHVSKIMLVQV